MDDPGIMETKWKEAGRAFAASVAKRFPVGARVLVRWGAGEMWGTVRFAPHGTSYPGSVGVASDRSGAVHWVHWKDFLECFPDSEL
jgi:hypothetical protein